MRFISRFFTPSQDSYFLFGPRGTGKTTWLKKHYPEALWINLLKPEQLLFYSATPEKLNDLLLANPEARGSTSQILDR